MAVITMSLADWENVPDNPRQRNTERRAKEASRKHLSKYSKTHEMVTAAVKDGNIICKLDGHTRSYLWSIGKLEGPKSGKVLVQLIDVESIAEAKELYDQIDSGKALKKPSDIVYGACRENNFELSSPLLRACQFITQLKVADSGNKFCGDPYLLVRRWKSVLMELDALNLSSNYTVLIALMLIAIRKDGVENAGPFFQMLDKDAGIKDSRGPDGILALKLHMDIRRAEGRTAGYDNLIDILKRGYTCYSEWRKGRRVKSLKSSDEVMDVINSFNDLKPKNKSLI